MRSMSKRCSVDVAVLVLVGALACAGVGAQAPRPNPSECQGAPAERMDTLIQTIASLPDSSFDSCSEESCTYQVDVAEDIEINYFADYKVAKNLRAGSGATYVLYPCGAERPAPALFGDIAVDYFEIPLHSVATTDSTATYILEALGVADRVRYASQYATSSCLLKVALDEEQGGCGREFDAEKTPLTNIDAEFVYGASDDAHRKSIAFSASSDPGPLNRAEHLLYVAAFFNKEKEGSELFKTIEDGYNELVTPVTDSSKKVLWVSYNANTFGAVMNSTDGSIDGDAYYVSFAAYKATITQAAGADNGNLTAWREAQVTDASALPDDVVFAPAAWNSTAEMFAAMKPMLRNVDILIDETYYVEPANATVDDFMKTWNISSTESGEYAFIANKALYRHDKRRTAQGSDDWFGEAVIRADYVLADMRAIVEPEAFSDHQLRYFRNIAQGEQAVLIGVSGCSDEELTCQSYDNQVALEGSAPADAAPVDAASSYAFAWQACLLLAFSALVML